ncbi:hypothetical protein [Luteibacter yeojuensis]|uniref:hypothetical protein n=1 Tax=Luteibacter yeojuensis TaxID=345309 RepID=UPI001965FF89|nr:hypothetical protein [Luteibacter yeojuensis]
MIVLTFGTYAASEWWERALGTYVESFDSPDGCLRVDTYRPFWVLPSFLHNVPHPDGYYEGYGSHWDSPVFKRLYERSTGELLGQTIVFDAAFADYGIDWGDPTSPGHRVISSARYALATTTRCADPETLSRLKAAYERGEWKGGVSSKVENGAWVGTSAYRLDERVR